MNALIDRPPAYAIANGRRYQIETDFRAAVAFEIMVDNGEEDGRKLLQPFYPQGLPEDVDGAAAAAFWFYRCGEDIPEKKEKAESTPPAYSFDFDADVILADFWNYYSIDLSSEYLHWWTFRALLAGLPDDSGYKQRIYYRTCETKGLPKGEQARINRIRKAIAIDRKSRKKLTLEERNALMLDYVAKRSEEAAKGG